MPWSWPGTVSTIRLPARFEGRVRLDVHVVSACDDAAVRSLRVGVQGRPVEHRLETRTVGVGVVADVEFDPKSPAEMELAIGHTRHLGDPGAAASPEPAGLAVGAIQLLPVVNRTNL